MYLRIKHLLANLVIYGLGDVATTAVSFLLLPVYTRYLTPEDYGVLALLLIVEAFAKIVFRWGVDSSFLRFYYDCRDDRARQRLASTVFFFLLAVNGSILVASYFLAPQMAVAIFGTRTPTRALKLLLFNTFIVGFHFIPFQVFRAENQSPRFISLTFARSVAVLVLRLVLVIGLRWGILGIVAADVMVTLVFTAVLYPWFRPLIRPVFSKAVLKDVLGFGLPRVPSGLAQQTVAMADRYILRQFMTLRAVGVYSIGATFGLALKLFLSAFENAWAPFYFSLMRDPDAKQTFARVTTYATAVLVLLAAEVSGMAPDLVRLMTTPQFFPAAAIVPWIALGVLLQGVYLLTSIGLNITKHTRYYPIATAVAAGVSVAANVILIPRFGVIGAAWSNVLSYGTLAALSMAFSQRFYPMRYENARLAKVAASGVLAYLAAATIVPPTVHPFLGLVLRSSIVGGVFLSLLWALDFFHKGELATIGRLWASVRRQSKRAKTLPPEPVELAGEIGASPDPETVEANGDGANGDGRPDPSVR